MEKEYYSKVSIIFLVILVGISPFGIFLYAFANVLVESLMATNVKAIEFIALNDLFFSITISAISTSISIIIGGLISFYLLNFSKSALNYGILNIVLVLPHIGFAYIIYLFFSDTGFLSRLLNLIGIENDLPLINDTLGIGIILNYVLKEVPFVILYLLATNKTEVKNHIFAARDLGAGFLQTFLKIYVPLNSVQIVSISIVIFAFVLGNYEVPFLLGGNAPQCLSVSALSNFQSIDLDQNIASYLKAVIIFTTAFVVSVILRLCVREKR